MIGGRPYTVVGDTLQVEDIDITIDDPDVWRILIAKNPGKKQTESALKCYRNIVKRLDLVSRITGKHVRTRIKYGLLTVGKGLYTTVDPPHASTIIIPSNGKKLLRTLIQALGELRAGNEAMRNTVVSFAQAAASRGLLPKDLLNPQELTWAYA